VKSLPRLEGLLLVGAGLFALLFQLWVPSTHVEERDYQAVAQVLTAEAQPGDVVLLHPWWTERARIYVPEGLPVVGHLFSDGDALERHPRIWVLSEPHLPRDGEGAFETAFNPGRTAVGAARDFGNLRLQLFTNGRYRPLAFDAVDVLSSAQVYFETPDGQRQPCNPAGNGFRCPNGKVVARMLREVHYVPYTCVQMEAPGGATRLMMEFTAPRAAESSTLQAGYIWEYGSCKETCSSSTVYLEVDGHGSSMELAAGDEAMHRLEGPPMAEGAKVRFGLLAQNPNARVVCFVLTGNGRTP